MTEAEFQQKVADTARWYGWLVVHHDGDQRGKAWFDTAGFPDLTLVHRDRPVVWFRELKSECGVVSPAQQAWIDRLTLGGHNAAVWRPADFPDIVRALSTGRARVAAG